MYSYSLNNPKDKVYQTKESTSREDDSYMGYSSASGDFTGDGQQGVAVGMPRGGHLLGKVLIYSWNLTNTVNITGEQIGAYFGYSIASIDVDGDKLDDLIIGAPMFTPANNEGKYETGMVYIVYQTKERVSRNVLGVKKLQSNYNNQIHRSSSVKSIPEKVSTRKEDLVCQLLHLATSIRMVLATLLLVHHTMVLMVAVQFTFITVQEMVHSPNHRRSFMLKISPVLNQCQLLVFQSLVELTWMETDIPTWLLEHMRATRRSF